MTLFLNVICLSQDQPLNIIRFDTISAYPPSVTSGADISITASFINITNIELKPEDYAIYAEIFDQNGKMLTVTNKTQGIIPLTSNQIASLTFNYRVPDNYSGTISYRIKFEYKKEIVKETDGSHKFNVTSKNPEKPGIPIKLKGSISLSYSSDSGKGTPSNIPTEFTAMRGEQQSLSIAGNLVYDSGFPSLQNYLIGYKSKTMNTNVGVFYPTFSELSLSGIGGEGIGIEGPMWKDFKYSVIDVRTHRADPASGVFRQNLNAYRFSYGKSQDHMWGISYFNAGDSSGSVSASTSSPVSNSSIGFDLKSKISKSAVATFDISRSGFNDNTNGASGTIRDMAYKFRFSGKRFRRNYEFTYKHTGADFKSLGASPAKDQQGYDFTYGNQLTKSLSLNSVLSRYNSNLEKNPIVNSLISSNSSLSMSFNKQKYPGVSISYNVSDARNGAIIITNTNYSNRTFSLSVSQKLGQADLSINNSRADYRDFTLTSHNTRTSSSGFSLSTKVRKVFSVTSNLTSSKSADLFDMSSSKNNVIGLGLNYTPEKSRLSYHVNLNSSTSAQPLISTKSNSLSFGGSFALIPDSLKANLEYSLSGSKAGNGTSDTSSANSRLSLDYNVTKADVVTFELSHSDTKDKINPSQNNSNSSWASKYQIKF